MTAPKQTKKSGLADTARSYLFGLLILLLFSGLYHVYLYFFSPQDWYAEWYKVPKKNVEIEKKPHDCEFLTAPIGSKHCHYNKDVSVIPSKTGKYVYVSYERVDE